jgi:hypothetical protein
VSNHVYGRARIVLEYVSRYGHPFLPLPDPATRGTEEHSRALDRHRELSTKRLDEMADALCLPIPYLVAILVKLEDRSIIDWRTGAIAPAWRSPQQGGDT